LNLPLDEFGAVDFDYVQSLAGKHGYFLVRTYSSQFVLLLFRWLFFFIYLHHAVITIKMVVFSIYLHHHAVSTVKNGCFFHIFTSSCREYY